MRLRIGTWNVNSVRLRLAQVLRLLRDENLDVLGLQETKCVDAVFPAADFARAGWPFLSFRGKPGYNGCALVSRLPFNGAEAREFCGLPGDARHAGAIVRVGAREVGIECLYVPSGGDVPDGSVNPKFAHKLAFLAELAALARALDDGTPRLLLGDLNVAPLPEDVFDHAYMSRIVSHTPGEVAALEGARAAGRLVDVLRIVTPPPARAFTWWSYRAADWRASNRGLRLDHLWASPSLAAGLVDARIARETRGWDRPSDHAPVVAEFEV